MNDIEKAIEIMQDMLEFCKENKTQEWVEKANHYRAAISALEKQLQIVRGRLVMLPCGLGKTIFSIEKDNTISKWYAYGFVKYDGQVWSARAKNNKNKWKYIDKNFMFSDFGKIVFATRAEAEKALKEGKE